MADVTSTLNSWSSTSSSNLPANSASVGPNTLADNQRTIQAVVRAALAGDGTIASATTTDLSTVNDGDITVTGTTTITGFGTLTAGIKKVLTFSGALTLTHNATSLILPGAANITTAAGDVAIMRSLGSGNWKCIAFTRSASLPATAGANTDITSMTALTAPTAAANPMRATDLQAQAVTAFTTGGTSTAFTLTPAPAITAYATNQEWDVSFSAACGAAPTFQVSGLAMPPNLVKQNADGTYSNLSAGDFPIGWQSKVKMVSTTQALVRSLPTSVVTSKIQPITASVASSALTISASSLTLDFRSTTLGSGTVTTVTGTPANLVISSGSTLGTVNATQSRIAVLALNNAGTIELAAVNIAGGNDLTETGVISTTAEGGAGAADSNNVIYSTTARTSAAYRVIGYIESTQATAGTWATAPSTIQGVGGQALAALSSLGYGQSWQSVTRTSGTTYYNTTGKPVSINVQITGLSSVIATVTASVNGGAGFVITHAYGAGVNAIGNGYTTIPAGASYVLTDANITARTTYELR